jgi:hypothetical protein
VLPDGFRLADEDDAAFPCDHIACDARPTIDSMNPGGGTFITRLIGPGGRELAIVQGAGASIYTRRDERRCIGCFEDPAGEAPLGDLPGTLFALDPPAVLAFDDNFGHMIVGIGMDLAELREIAAKMAPVR